MERTWFWPGALQRRRLPLFARRRLVRQRATIGVMGTATSALVRRDPGAVAGMRDDAVDPTRALAPLDPAQFVDATHPPAEGALVPVEDGWVIAHAEGHRPWQLAPPRRRLGARVVAALPAATIGAGVLASYSLVAWAGSAPVIWGGHLPAYILQLLALGDWPLYLPLLGGAAAMLGAHRASTWLVHRVLARGAARLPLVTNPSQVPDGRRVRVHGVIGSGRTFASPVSGRPSVLAHAVLGRDPLQGMRREDLRGIDFVMRLADGADVQVRIRDAVLLARPGEPRRGRATELTLGPGDRVEIVGHVHRHPDVTASAPGGRGDRLAVAIESGSDTPLLIRPVR